MTSAQRMKSTLRSWAVKPVTLFLFLYVVSLTCSIAGMEITAWTTAFFVIIYWLIDRASKTPTLEVHTIGVELPLILMIGVVAASLKFNAPQADFWPTLGSIRNILLLFFMAYALQIVKNLNRIMLVLVVCAVLISMYAIWQHFTGIDLWRQSDRALTRVHWGAADVFASVGFFSHHLTFAHSFMMILCVPWAAFILAKRASVWMRMAYLLAFLIILTALVFSYARGVWIAVLVALPVMSLFAGRKLFFSTLGILVLSCTLLYNFNTYFRERAQTIFQENYFSNEDRRKLWQINVEMFHEHPWLGVGYQQNENLSVEYYKKLGIENGMSGHAHSNYIEWLATTGLLGFVSYMLFILAFILMTARLFSMIPATHYWHRVFALAAMGAQLSFHVGGLSQWNFGDAEVQHQFIFWLALVGYMSHRYYVHIVPDDHSL